MSASNRATLPRFDSTISLPAAPTLRRSTGSANNRFTAAANSCASFTSNAALRASNSRAISLPFE
jgi:hypothetical protein